jgi:hypothetical protein
MLARYSAHVQTCQPVRFWRIFPILGLNFAVSTTVRFKAKKYVFSPNFFFLIYENDLLNRFIRSKMQNYVSFCLIVAHVGEKN